MTDTIEKALALVDKMGSQYAARDRQDKILTDFGMSAEVRKLLAESATVNAALDWSTCTPEQAQLWFEKNHPTLLPTGLNAAYKRNATEDDDKSSNPFLDPKDTEGQQRLVAMLRKKHGDAEGLKRARQFAAAAKNNKAA